MQSWTTIKKRLFKKPAKNARVKNSSYLLNKEVARKIINQRLEYYNQFYNLTYNRVSIKDQRRCWGSCSSKGNLNFNYRLIFLPLEVLDYIVVHELCHLRHFNHGAEFWQEVERILPDYKSHIKQLREFEKIYKTNPKLKAVSLINHNIV